MRESSTYQAILEEGKITGREEEARKTIRVLGRKRFGDLPHSVQTTLDAISDVETLDSLIARLLDVETWDELLAARKVL
jgi:hypothetical protein